MSTPTDRIVWFICGGSAVALTFALLGYAVAFSFVISILVILNFVLAYGPETRRKPIGLTLVVVLVVLWLLFASAASTHKPGGEIALLGGLPIGTAFFVYGIWPLGAVLCVLHVLVFDRSILPKEKLENLVAKFGRSDPQS